MVIASVLRKFGVVTTKMVANSGTTRACSKMVCFGYAIISHLVYIDLHVGKIILM
jgi:hypothetical protein